MENLFQLSKGSRCSSLSVLNSSFRSFTLKKLECSKQTFFVLNTLAWNNEIGLYTYFGRFGLKCRVMINRDSWGHLYFIVRGEILGFMKDKLMRKHLPRMFSLIKNESWGLEDD